jgi:nitroimidazol reductase NimA-like FMN-containing flavoprotein (pyridoxamine 5'-phosphate oxidase superfamily)
MRRKDKEITDIKQIEDILRRGRFCHIAMASGDDPYMVTVNYGYNDNCIYFHSAPDGHKLDIIRINPNVCFMVYVDDILVEGENPCNDWTMNYRSIIGYGEAIFLKTTAEKIEGLTLLMEHYSTKKSFEFDEVNLKKVNVIKIEIKSLTGKVSGYSKE